MAENAIEIENIVEISKTDAARSQLCEAIMLFFERRDPVSIHTLAWAALEIIHCHLPVNNGNVSEMYAFTHYHSIYIKEEYKKIFANKLREARNFFKHAARDLDKKIQFKPELNECVLLEAVLCYCRLEEHALTTIPEIQIFMSWLILKYPESLLEEYKKSSEYASISKAGEGINPDDFSMCVKSIQALRKEWR